VDRVNRFYEIADTVQVLIEHGADVTMQDDAHSTPLHLASSKGSFETVQLLLQHGADVAAQDGNNRTPLHLASSWVSAVIASPVNQQRVDVKDRTIAIPGEMVIRKRPKLCNC
jgi:ankyrin repeat protein